MPQSSIRRLAFSCCTLAVVLLLGACGGSSSDNSTDAKSSQAQTPSGQALSVEAASEAASGAQGQAASAIVPADTASAAIAASSASSGSAASARTTLAAALPATAKTNAAIVGSGGSGSGSGSSASLAGVAASTVTRGGSTTTAGASGFPSSVVASIVAAPDSSRRTIQAVATGSVSQATTTTYAPAFAGTAYYVHSGLGNDANAGTSDKPWQTLQRASRAQLNAGDALLLHCDGTWAERASFSKAFAPQGQVLIGAYGSCANGRRPLIKGGTAIAAAGWRVASTSANGTVYASTVAAPVTGMVQNGKPMQRARQPNYSAPNTAFSASLSGTGGTKLVVSAADKAALNGRDLVGAAVALRSAPYMIEAGEVGAYDATTGTITLKAAPRTAISAGAGYFLEGKSWMLDAPNEWLYDPASNTLSVFLPAGTSVAGTALEYVQNVATLTVSGIPGVRVENLAISDAGTDGLQVVESGGARVSQLLVSNARSNGINVLSTSGLAAAQGVTIDNNVVTGSGVSGIGSAVTESKILQNTVVDTGSAVIGILRPVAGIRLSQIKNSVVSGNDVRRSGYSAILFGNQANVQINDNHLEDSCLLLSDCGAIYSWGSSASTLRSSISNNHILRTSSPNLIGSGAGTSGGAPDLVAGIYLDEGSDNLDVTSNYIDDAHVGINLHKSKYNVIARNLIYGIREAGVRVQSSGTDSLSVMGNRVEDNVLFVPSYFVKGADGNPVSVGGTPQLWIHQTSAAGMFNSTAKNTVARNVAIHIAGDSSLRWILRSGASNLVNNSKAWAAYAPTDITAAPYLASVVSVQGTQLLGNSTMESTALPWTAYSYTSGAKIVQFGTQAACTGSCASLVPATSNDVLQQTGLTPALTGPDLMFVRYRAHALDKPTSAKVEVRGNVAPYPSAGYLEPATDIAPLGRLVREAFFARSLKGDIRLTIKATVAATLLVDSVELFQVSAMQLSSPLSYGRLVVNQSSQPTSVSCINVGFNNCTTVTETGAPVTWPLALPAKSARMLFSKDPSWLQN